MGGIFDSLGGLLIGLMAIATIAGLLYLAFGKSNVASMEQDLVVLRMQTQQFYFGTNYSDLSNETAIKAGIVPKSLIKGENLVNPWGGSINLSSDSANSSFTVELDNIPKDACIQLVRFQPESWDSVSVNGADIESSDVARIPDACSQTANTLAFTAR